MRHPDSGAIPLRFLLRMDSLKFRLLRVDEGEQITSLSRSTIYRLIKQEKFPAPLRMSGRVVRWRDDEVNEWISRRPRSARGEAARKHNHDTPGNASVKINT